MTVSNETPIGLPQLIADVGLRNSDGLTEAPRVATYLGDGGNSSSTKPKIARETLVTVQLSSIIDSVVKAASFSSMHDLISGGSFCWA